MQTGKRREMQESGLKIHKNMAAAVNTHRKRKTDQTAQQVRCIAVERERERDRETDRQTDRD